MIFVFVQGKTRIHPLAAYVFPTSTTALASSKVYSMVLALYGPGTVHLPKCMYVGSWLNHVPVLGEKQVLVLL